ncbi:50S ribosomal protein L18 [Persicimonas caeni]|uniref:Large ribosomal subunit protein uL18 n=1 Tax=Persicimonas caeni TaxID=2292766 RepID=A0A4Y6Q369_PERCE|nr:50S ribosomal protein L18 [Persicimonas caeni]QDG54919.1 50S ribosomal protein L18 [Persicimonas caeni]QED36140.1 50S ribosomal protein L18 [Persicimonas caeni]
MLKKRELKSKRQRRKRSIRKKILGTPNRPRLSVYRSNKHIYAQVIDDINGHTVASASTVDKEMRDDVADLEKEEQARQIGKRLAERVKEKGIEKVVFDRNGFIYHGRVAAVADGAREGGLEF